MQKKIISIVILFVFVFSSIGTLVISTANINEQPKKHKKNEENSLEEDIFSTLLASDNAKITFCGKGFLMEFPDNPQRSYIIHLQGSPYEMGYQHGFLMADIIFNLSSLFGTPIFAQFGGWTPDGVTPPTEEQWELGRMILAWGYYTYFDQVIQEKAPEYYQEMMGVIQGLADAGSPVDPLDVLIFNAFPEVAEPMLYFPSGECEDMILPKLGESCSDLMVWGKATKNHALLHGTNFDFETFNILDKCTGVVVANPTNGYTYMGHFIPIMTGVFRGLNTKGISTGEPTSSSPYDADIISNPQIPHSMHSRKVLQYASCINDAINIMKEYGGTTGWNIPVASAFEKRGVDIEVSCNHLGVVGESWNTEYMISTNQYTAYPNFRGYAGENMVQYQILWSKVDTLEKWLAYHSKRSSWARFNRLEELTLQNFGKIDVSKMIAFMSDTNSPICRDGAEIQLAPECEQMYGLIAPIISHSCASVISMVYYGKIGMVWVASKGSPAQLEGGYFPINLYLHLILMKLYEKKVLNA